MKLTYIILTLLGTIIVLSLLFKEDRAVNKIQKRNQTIESANKMLEESLK